MSKSKQQTWMSLSGHEMYYNEEGRPRRVKPPKTESKVNTKYNEYEIRDRNIRRLKPSLPTHVYHSSPTKTVHHHYDSKVVNQYVVDENMLENKLKKEIRALVDEKAMLSEYGGQLKKSSPIPMYCHECGNIKPYDVRICEYCGAS